MSKVTSICGTPRGAGGMSVRSKRPSDLLSAARWRSPCSTWIVTADCPSSAVENTWLARVGMVVFLSIRRVMTWPSVSMPKDSGVTSSSNTSLTLPESTPAWMAAPSATASSGFTSLRGSRPKKSRTASWTLGMRIWPPTRITSLMSPTERPASDSAVRQGSIVRAIRSSTRASSLARVTRMFRCLGPSASAVMNGRLISVCCCEDSSILAFSEASLRRCMASGSLRMSTPCSFSNWPAR